MGYCRVSTDKEDQANSFESQKNYFKTYIERQPEWELYEIYADEGITGTSTKKRTAFNRMLQDARKGKFQIIITKEVSRFSRNILDTIMYTRELKTMGISVIFLNDGITTADADSELRLSIMGSIAQEESRKTSERVKWGQTRQMEKGVVFGRSMLGYDVQNGQMFMNREGAEIVKLIFRKYGVEKKGTSVIARELQEEGYQTYTGNKKWSSAHIIKILKNEKYVGDLVQKKTVTPNYLTHEKKYNHGEEPLVCIKNHHEPIVERELWELVQEEIKKRNLHEKNGKGHSTCYPFSGKIKCSECGANFISRQKKCKDGSVCRRWGCLTAAREGKKHLDSHGDKCGCNIGWLVREEYVIQMMQQVLKTLRLNKKELISRVTEIAVQTVVNDTKSIVGAKKVTDEYEQLKRKKAKMFDAFWGGSISKADMEMMKTHYEALEEELLFRKSALKTAGIEVLEKEKLKACIEKQVLEFVSGIVENQFLYKNILEQIDVYPDGYVVVRLKLLSLKWHFRVQ